MYKKHIITMVLAIVCIIVGMTGRSEAVRGYVGDYIFFCRVDNIEIYYKHAWMNENADNAGWRNCGLMVYEKNLEDPSNSYTYTVKGIYKEKEPLIYNIYGFGSVRIDYDREEYMNVEGSKIDAKGNLLGGTNGRNIIVPLLLSMACGEKVAPPATLAPDVAQNAPCPLSQQKGYQYIGKYDGYDVYCVPVKYIKPDADNGNREKFQAEVYFEDKINPANSSILQYAWQYMPNGRMYYKHKVIRDIERPARLFEMFDNGYDNASYASFGWHEILPQADIDAVTEGSDVWRRMNQAHIKFQKEQMELLKRMERVFDKSLQKQPYAEEHKMILEWL